jgi:hypothetical protein
MITKDFCTYAIKILRDHGPFEKKIFKSHFERSRGPTSQPHAHRLLEWPKRVHEREAGALLPGDGLPVREYFAEPPGRPCQRAAFVGRES